MAGGGWLLYHYFSGRPPVVATTVKQREAAFKHFTQAMEAMEALENGQGNENNLVAALENAELATRLDPNEAQYWHLLGYIYSKLRKDQFSEVMAEDALNKALKLSPGDVSSRLLLAGLLLDRQSYALALDHLEWVGRKDPKLLTSPLVADMCRAYVVDEQAARGERFFQEMLKARPESSALRLAMAILLHQNGKNDEALRRVAALSADAQADPADVAYARELEAAWRGGKS